MKAVQILEVTIQNLGGKSDNPLNLSFINSLEVNGSSHRDIAAN